ncbi:hypothetical protein [Rickettsiales endosymbiont of Stachyamoeba lipophora]|uniref:hypothetical protein n=1 Tax=Rickettsiales endosymbiont of Stachyamoeba lipophora TaxID=2486578 RepID=UPI000F647526|nr:hypothetical protein [Rickettsiales endosymbiont of Stachyamoeba lipophora]AZL15378.1 hypothetical protein EF513_02250 [Rickettsiales endosymbiont of Stachyamoeba lipophora]
MKQHKKHNHQKIIQSSLTSDEILPANETTHNTVAYHHEAIENPANDCGTTIATAEKSVDSIDHIQLDQLTNQTANITHYYNSLLRSSTQLLDQFYHQYSNSVEEFMQATTYTEFMSITHNLLKVNLECSINFTDRLINLHLKQIAK